MMFNWWFRSALYPKRLNILSGYVGRFMWNHGVHVFCADYALGINQMQVWIWHGKPFKLLKLQMKNSGFWYSVISWILLSSSKHCMHKQSPNILASFTMKRPQVVGLIFWVSLSHFQSLDVLTFACMTSLAFVFLSWISFSQLHTVPICTALIANMIVDLRMLGHLYPSV